MSRKGRTGKRLVKRKSSYSPGTRDGDRFRDAAHRDRQELRRG